MNNGKYENCGQDGEIKKFRNYGVTWYLCPICSGIPIVEIIANRKSNQINETN